MSYSTPLKDMMFAAETAGLTKLAELPNYADASEDLFAAVLEEAGKFASEQLAPLNSIGDQQGSRLVDGQAVTPPGWQEAYQAFIDAGWNSLTGDPKWGGQGLPNLFATAVTEIWNSANISFALCPLLTQGAIESIAHHGSDELKETYLPKMISGEWNGTMNLTEPQAGTDLAAIKTRAVPNGDHYLISGQKIFITYGDNDLTKNIIHLVLAKTPDAPEGVKGISLFVVPKFILDADGNPSERNDIETIALEHKMGIHGSPTAALAYGPNDGAVGYLVGEENQGLIYMFTMMNNARHTVGLQGTAVSHRAYLHALSYAKERIQGNDIRGGAERVAISQHPDVKRMLLEQKANIEAVRSLQYFTAVTLDFAAHHAEQSERLRYQRMVEVLIPIAKGFATEVGQRNVSLALQIHGGMGFIEETGAAQFVRDQRITTIYEGTTGIQAMDLMGRKLLRDGGGMVGDFMAMIRDDVAAYEQAELSDMQNALATALGHLETATQRVLASGADDPAKAASVCEAYLMMWGVTACGWRMLVSAEHSLQTGQMPEKLNTAKFYFAHEVSRTAYYLTVIEQAAALIADCDDDFFSA